MGLYLFYYQESIYNYWWGECCSNPIADFFQQFLLHHVSSISQVPIPTVYRQLEMYNISGTESG